MGRLEHDAERCLQDALANIGRVSGGEFYLPVSGLDSAISVCLDESLVILGIEAFILKDKKFLKPELDLIAHFSSLLQGGGTWNTIVAEAVREARLFVDRMPIHPDRLLNFTLISEDEFRGRGNTIRSKN